MSARKKLAIIDGKSVFYRGYYAMPSLSTKDGTPTGGVYGFAAMALELVKNLKPDFVCVAWDKPKTNIRSRLKIYSEYKAGRKPAPPDFYVQIPLLHELLDAFGWPLYELDDYEADDIMATLATQATAKDIETMLITSDLDALQVVHPLVHVYALKKGFSNIEMYNPTTFEAKYGLKVDQFLDLKALKGDSSDNIPGVPGIGEKTAIELLKQYKTLDNVYDNLVLIKESVRRKLEAGKDLADMSKKLGELWTDAPIKLNLKEVDGSKFNPAQVRQVLEKLEFKTLARQLPDGMNEKMSNEPRAVSSELATTKVVVIDSQDKLKHLDLSAEKQVVLYSRAGGKHGKNPQLLIIGTPKAAFVLDLQKLRQIPYSIFHIPVVGYDLKLVFNMLLELGIGLPKVEHDVQMGAFLLNSLRREQNLYELARADLGYSGTDFINIDNEELIHRAGEVCAVIRTLYEEQVKDLAKNPKVRSVAEDIEWPNIPVLARMEHLGIGLDTKQLHKFSGELEGMISDTEQHIYGHADVEFNISSPSQLAEVLFEKMGLPKAGIKKGKTGYSTAASELDKLRAAHPIIDLITQYRELTKLKNTYVDPLPLQVDENSRLHTTYETNVAPTGRLSSRDPNLQNIPTRSELGKKIRDAFVAGKGNVFISADYSQFELRIAAVLSKDKSMIDAFNNDVDIHLATAAQIHGRNPEDVTKSMRSSAKAVNFGVMYGLGVHGLATGTGMSYEQAKSFIDKYFELRPELLKYIESVREQARKDGYVETMFGRRRPTPDVHSSNFIVREAAMRAAVNMPFQGSAADIMKMAMVKVQQELDQWTVDSGQLTVKPRMLLQIHDSLILECPESEAKEVAKKVKEIMETVVKLPVKLTVDTSTGKTWGDL